MSMGLNLGRLAILGTVAGLLACYRRPPEEPGKEKKPIQYPTPPFGFDGLVWTHENNLSSDGTTADPVTFSYLPLAGKEFQGRFVTVSGLTPVNGLFKCEPFAEGSKVTQDCFDQGQLYFSLSTNYDYLNYLGFDLARILASKHEGEFHPVNAMANGIQWMNAYYSPWEDRLVFGTSDNKWHLASDSDVTLHEFGHMVLDHINPMLVGAYGEGRAIHEAFGDAFAALYFDDPEVSEDFPPVIGQPSGKDKGLRTVKNNLRLSDVSREEHDRGQVYAGFWWSLYKNLSALPDRSGKILGEKEARILALRLLINHAAHYQTAFPKPADFLDAVSGGAEGLESVGLLPVPLHEVVRLVGEEGRRRELAATPPSGRSASIDLFQEPIIMKDLEVALQHYRDQSRGRILFRQVARLPYLGGRVEYYQQQYKTKQQGVVDVIDHGLRMREDLQGWRRVLLRDVRTPFKSGMIDEQVGIASETAGQLAREALNDRWTRFQAEPPQNEEERLLQQTLELCRQFDQSSTRYEPKLVIYGDHDYLSWAVPIGYGTFFVPAMRGRLVDPDRIIFRPEIFY